MKNCQKTEHQLPVSRQANLNQTTLPIQVENIEIVQAPVKECRICLGSTYTYDNPLISPCECIGSLKFIHKLCLKKWMEIKLAQNLEEYIENNEINCQLCKKAIQVQVSLKRNCRKCSQIQNKIKQNPLIFAICIISLVVSLGVLFFSIRTLDQQIQQGYNNVDLISRAVILAFIPVQILLVLYFIVQLIKFCVVKRATLQFG